MTQLPSHTPVLLEEVLHYFKPTGKSSLLDCTLGLGGHTKAFLEVAGKESTAVGFDADSAALDEARRNLEQFGDRVTFIHARFTQLPQKLNETQIELPFSHILFDLGIGSHQLSDMARGFSFQSDAPLDMHYGTPEFLPPAHVESLNQLEQSLGVYPNASDIIELLPEHELAEVIRVYGEERYAMRIARAIGLRHTRPRTARELASTIEHEVGGAYAREHIHPATRTFQALRIAANRELESLEVGLRDAETLLGPEGILGVISFHSLEDRIVKQYFRKQSRDCICPPEQIECICNHTASLAILTKKPVGPSEEEISSNPRSRSAKLRVAQRIAPP